MISASRRSAKLLTSSHRIFPSSSRIQCHRKRSTKEGKDNLRQPSNPEPLSFSEAAKLILQNNANKRKPAAAAPATAVANSPDISTIPPPLSSSINNRTSASLSARTTPKPRQPEAPGVPLPKEGESFFDVVDSSTAEATPKDPIEVGWRYYQDHLSSSLPGPIEPSIEEWLRERPPLDETAEELLPMLHHVMMTAVQQDDTTNEKEQLQAELERNMIHCSTDNDWPLENHQPAHPHEGIFDRRRQRHRREEQRATPWFKAKKALARITHQGAKHGHTEIVPFVWYKMKQAGMMDQNILHTMLYLASSRSSRTRRGARTNSHPRRYELASTASVLDMLDDVAQCSNSNQVDVTDSITDEIATVHDILYTPTEQTIQVRVKRLVDHDQPHEAEELLEEARLSHVPTLRLRAYVPVLRLYLDLGDIPSALSLYRRMIQDMPMVHLDVDTHVVMLAALAEQGWFHLSGKDREQQQRGPELFHQLMEQIAEDLIEVPMSSAQRLYNAFLEGCPDSAAAQSDFGTVVSGEDALCDDYGLVAARVQIDATSGQCPATGAQLRLIHLEPDQRHQFQNSVMELARQEQVSFQEQYNKKSKRKNKRVAAEEKHHQADAQLQVFLQTLDEREGEPFTAIVDGANVGYYMQNFGSGRFSYHQIEFVVQALEELGERPLVILPYKYARAKSFALSQTLAATDDPSNSTTSTVLQHLTKEELEIRDRLRQQQKIYTVPQGVLDDFYWILASTADQTISCNGVSMDVPPNDPVRWPGTRPVLVSNDQMRDHKMNLLEPRLFRRWRSNYIVNYNFCAFVDGVCTNPDIQFTPPDAFSWEIQGNDDGRGNSVWHLPLKDTENEWLCLRLPTQGSVDD